MKKITLLLSLLLFAAMSAQQKSTGTVTILPDLSASLLLDNTAQLATMTISGPSDRWFAITFGSFNQPGAMSNGNDVVYFNGSTLVDARHNGQGTAPSADAVNNWTVTDNSVESGVRTIVATRPFVGDGTDFTFSYGSSSINLAGAHAASPIMATLQYHQENRNNFGAAELTELGVEDFSLNASMVSPNPVKGFFTVKTKTSLDRINIYTHAGSLVRTVVVTPGNAETSVTMEGLQSGIYMIELQNANSKAWKKIILE